MDIQRTEELPLGGEADIVRVRQATRRIAAELRFSPTDQTKVATAASELARNCVDHAGGGSVRIDVLLDGARRGIRLAFEDNGPGIADVEQAMRDGFSSRGGLGLGLGGAKRLSHEFEIESQVGRGTRVVIARWTR